MCSKVMADDLDNDEDPILSGMLPTIVEIDDDLVPGFVQDLAQGIHHKATIAMRYGLGTEANLLLYLQQHPVVLNQIRRHKAALNSDAAVTDRVRLKAGLAVEDLIPELTHIVRDGGTPTGQRIDGFHKLMRAAGTDGNIATGKEGLTQGGPGLNITIQFSNGENIKISTPTDYIEAEDVL